MMSVCVFTASGFSVIFDEQFTNLMIFKQSMGQNFSESTAWSLNFNIRYLHAAQRQLLEIECCFFISFRFYA